MPAFRLDYNTPPEWVERVERDPLRLLSDHAHCELKAAASAQTLIVRNPRRETLVRELASVALEELSHFQRVLGLLEARGGKLDFAEPSPYAEGLQSCAGHDSPNKLLDRLLLSHLIELRSLERFHLLAEHLRDRELADLYRDLMASEASHQALFVRLAKDLCPAELVEQRETQLRAREGALVARLAFDGRMHCGLQP
jgi:tRNA 2-(methylsulfanyl)-N6-isopentenyladenosine37 hydroxylase